MKPNFRERQFWLALRRDTSVYGRVGVEECASWCEDALNLLTRYDHGFQEVNGILGTTAREKLNLFVNSHWFLYRKYKEGIFIADGTAGQIVKTYPRGYYGYAEDAPLALSIFYNDGLRNQK